MQEIDTAFKSWIDPTRLVRLNLTMQADIAAPYGMPDLADGIVGAGQMPHCLGASRCATGFC